MSDKCPICHKELAKGYLDGTTITQYCTNNDPYNHFLKKEAWIGYYNQHPTYGTSLTLPFPTRYSIVFGEDDIWVLVLSIDEEIISLVLKYGDEDPITTDNKEILSLIDYSKLPQLIKSIVVNSAFL